MKQNCKLRKEKIKPVLVISCQNYPFSRGEHLLKDEISEHLKNFSKVIVVSSGNKKEQNHEVNDSVEVEHFAPKASIYKLLINFDLILSPLLAREVYAIFKNYRLYEYPKLIRRAVFALLQARMFGSFFKPIINKYGIKCLVFYSYWMTNATLGFCLLKSCYPELKIYSRARAIDLYFYRHRPPYLPFRNYIFGELNKVFAISNEGKAYIKDNFDFNNKPKVKISRLGVRGSPRLNDYEFCSPLILVSCSNVIPLKRIDYIIDGLNYVQNSIKWIHFGDGTGINNITNYANKILLPKQNISFEFRGYVKNKELLSFYANNRVDLFINLSQYEGVPVSIMEAFSFGVPAIATDVGGVSELVNETNGFLIPVEEKNPVMVGNIIDNYFVSDKKQKLMLRSAAFNTYKIMYDLGKNFAELSREIANSN